MIDTEKFINSHPSKISKKTAKECYWLNEKDKGLYIDLFCGAGGLSLGLERNGFKHALSVDFDKDSIDTYRFNRPHIDPNKILKDDIINLTKNKWKGWAKLRNKIDIIAGGPPCQGFSTANRRRLIHDPRNSLYKNFIHTVDIFKPKVVLMENVTGILNKKEEIRKDFHDIGYFGDAIKLSAQAFGVPQNRVRVFFIMISNKVSYEKQITMTSQVLDRLNSINSNQAKFNLNNAISDLPAIEANPERNNTTYENGKCGSYIMQNPNTHTSLYVESINQSKFINEYIFNHKSLYHNDRDLEIYRRLPQGGDSTHESIADIMPYTTRTHMFKDKFYKLKYEAISKAITAHMKVDTHMYIHPTQARGLSPREAARVQSFPDNYIFKGSLRNWYKQIGNAVPPKLAYTIIKTMKDVILNEA